MSHKVLIVVSNYYSEISKNLIEGATQVLKKSGINYNIKKIQGSFEIPFVINTNLESYDGFIALGCIIKGETYHFALISNEVTRKIMDISISTRKPIGFGIITCENMNQAKARSVFNKNENAANKSVKKNNKGAEAAFAILDLL